MMRFGFFTLCLCMCLLIAEGAFAQSPGRDLYCMVFGGFRGNLGVVFGFLIAFAGFFIFIFTKSKVGIYFIIAGAAITAFPGLFSNGLSSGTLLMTDAPDRSAATFSCP